MSSEDILYIHPEKVKLRNELGSPFVIISKNPVEDPHNPKGSDHILLKTEDGTLLSLRESFADGNEGENTGLTIELFDPDHLFLMQFIDNNSVKVIRSALGSKEGGKSFAEAYALLDDLIRRSDSAKNQKSRSEGLLKRVKDENTKQDDKPSMTPVTDFVVDFLFNDDDFIQRHEDSIKRNDARIKELDASSNNVRAGLYSMNNYITYGYGKDNISRSRSFQFSKLEFLHDSGKQGGVRLHYVHNTSLNQDENLKRRGEVYTGYQDDTMYAKGDATVAIIDFKNTVASKVTFDDTSDIANLMEYTLQDFMREQATDSGHTPLVFLSPEVTPRILQIIESARNLDPLKGPALERAGSSDPTLLVNSRMLSLKKLLEDFGFKLHPESINPVVLDATFSKVDGVTPIQSINTTYVLKIIIDKNKSAKTQVTNIIRNMYNKLGITAGSDIVNENMNDPELLKYFYDKFLDGTGNLRNSILTTQSEKKEYRNVRPIRTKEELPPIHLIGDGLFIMGVIYKLPYTENEKVHKLYNTVAKGSNIERFIKNFKDYSEYLELIRRIFVDPVRKAGRFTTSDEYAAKLPNQVFNKLTESIPSFLSNTDNANVISFVATHKGQEFSELLNTVALPFKHTFFKSIKDGDTEKTLKGKKELSKEQIEVLLEDMLSFEFGNSDDTVALLEYMNEGFDSKNSDTAAAYKKILDTFLLRLEDSPLYKDHDVSEHAVRAYMMYMQKLSNRVSVIKVKSVPMFPIAPDFWINKPCLFLNKKLFTPNSTFQLNREGAFSGIYSMLGLEHVISGSECYSSFTLSKIHIATGEIAKATPGK